MVLRMHVATDDDIAEINVFITIITKLRLACNFIIILFGIVISSATDLEKLNISITGRIGCGLT